MTTTLTLPREFYGFLEEDHDKNFQYKGSKEEKRDLEAIEEVTNSTAYVRCLCSFFDEE